MWKSPLRLRDGHGVDGAGRDGPVLVIVIQRVAEFGRLRVNRRSRGAWCPTLDAHERLVPEQEVLDRHLRLASVRVWNEINYF